MTPPLLYQLQNANYQSLFKTDFRVGVVDMDDTGLTASQVAELTGGQEKILLTYLSIGEAEDYRPYWQDEKWTDSPPDFLLGENPNWEGNFLVKFWDTDWQKIMFARVDEAVKLGYSGMYLDIVDAYDVASVRNAYSGSNDALRKEMIDFVIALSAHAKAIDPDFMVVPQNAVGLLALNQNNPGGAPNTAYLNAIDGLGVEDLWYDGDSRSSWTKYDLEYIEMALNAGKFVLATSYPSQDAKQVDFIDNAINAGLIPFVADRDLTGTIDPINNTIEEKLAGKSINFPEMDAGDGATNGDGGDVGIEVGGADGKVPEPATDGSDQGVTIDGTSKADKITGGGGVDIFNGRGGNDWIRGGGGEDFIRGGGGRDALYGGAGDDTLKGGSGRDALYGGAGDDTLKGGSGDDTVVGGAGADTLWGRGGNDVFVFNRGDGHDRVRDFERGTDRIDVSGMASIDFDALDTNGNGVIDQGDAHVDIVRSKTIIDLGEAADAADASTLTLNGVTGLTELDFIF